MKTAIYIEDGVVQLVLTPEGKFEKSTLKSFEDKPTECKIFTGSFYDCRGGWVRQSEFMEPSFQRTNNSDSSLILSIKTDSEKSNEQNT